MQVATTIDGESGMVVKRLSVPVGLEELMESLTKQVLMKKPKDLFTFASEHFAHLVAIREKLNGNEKHVSNPSEVKQLKVKSITSGTKFSALPTPIIFTNSKTSRPITTPKFFHSEERSKKTRFNQPSLIRTATSKTNVSTQKERAKWNKQPIKEEPSPPKKTPREIREAYTFRRDGSKHKSKDRGDGSVRSESNDKVVDKVIETCENSEKSRRYRTRRDAPRKQNGLTPKITPRTRSNDSINSLSAGIGVNGKGITKTRSIDKLNKGQTRGVKNVAKVVPILTGGVVLGGTVAANKISKTRNEKKRKERSRSSQESDVSEADNLTERSGTSELSVREVSEGAQQDGGQENEDESKKEELVERKEGKHDGDNSKEDLGKIEEESNVEDVQHVIVEQVEEGKQEEEREAEILPDDDISGSIASNAVIGTTTSDVMHDLKDPSQLKDEAQAQNVEDDANDDVTEMEASEILHDDDEEKREDEAQDVIETKEEVTKTDGIANESDEKISKKDEQELDTLSESIQQAEAIEITEKNDVGFVSANMKTAQDNTVIHPEEMQNKDIIDETVKNILCEADKHDDAEVKNVLFSDGIEEVFHLDKDAEEDTGLPVIIEVETKEITEKQGEIANEDDNTDATEEIPDESLEPLTVDGKHMVISQEEKCIVVDTEEVIKENQRYSGIEMQHEQENKEKGIGTANLTNSRETNDRNKSSTDNYEEQNGESTRKEKNTGLDTRTKQEPKTSEPIFKDAEEVVKEQLFILKQMDKHEDQPADQAENKKDKRTVINKIQQESTNVENDARKKEITNKDNIQKEEEDNQATVDSSTEREHDKFHVNLSTFQFAPNEDIGENENKQCEIVLATITKTPSLESIPQDTKDPFDKEEIFKEQQHPSIIDDDGPLSIEDVSKFLQHDKISDTTTSTSEALSLSFNLETKDYATKIEEEPERKSAENNATALTVNEANISSSSLSENENKEDDREEDGSAVLAAIKIQSTWRGHHVRKQIETNKIENKEGEEEQNKNEGNVEKTNIGYDQKVKAATVVQAFLKGNLAKRKNKRLVQQSNKMQIEELEEQREMETTRKEGNQQEEKGTGNKDDNTLPQNEEELKSEKVHEEDEKLDAYMKLSDSIDQEINKVLEKLEKVSVPDEDLKLLEHDRNMRSLDFSLEDVEEVKISEFKEELETALKLPTTQVQHDEVSELHDIQEESDENEEMEHESDTENQIKDTEIKQVDEDVEVDKKVDPIKLTKEFVETEKKNYVVSPNVSPKSNSELASSFNLADSDKERDVKNSETTSEIALDAISATKDFVNNEVTNHKISPNPSLCENASTKSPKSPKSLGKDGIIAGALETVGGFLTTSTTNLKNLLSPKSKANKRKSVEIKDGKEGNFIEEVTEINRPVESIRIRLRDDSIDNLDDDDVSIAKINAKETENKTEIDKVDGMDSERENKEMEAEIIEDVSEKDTDVVVEHMDNAINNNKIDSVKLDRNELISASENFVDYEKKNYVSSSLPGEVKLTQIPEEITKKEEGIKEEKEDNVNEQKGHTSQINSGAAIGAVGGLIATHTDNIQTLLSSDSKTLTAAKKSFKHIDDPSEGKTSEEHEIVSNKNPEQCDDQNDKKRDAARCTEEGPRKKRSIEGVNFDEDSNLKTDEILVNTIENIGGLVEETEEDIQVHDISDDTVAGIINDSTNTLTETKESIVEETSDIIDDLKEAIDNKVEEMDEIVGEVEEQMENVADQRTTEEIASEIKHVDDILTNKFTDLTSEIDKVNEIKDDVTGKLHDTKELIKESVENVQDDLNTAEDGDNETIYTITQDINDTERKFEEEIKEVKVDADSVLKKEIEKIHDVIKDADVKELTQMSSLQEEILENNRKPISTSLECIDTVDIVSDGISEITKGENTEAEENIMETDSENDAIAEDGDSNNDETNVTRLFENKADHNLPRVSSATLDSPSIEETIQDFKVLIQKEIDDIGDNSNVTSPNKWVDTIHDTPQHDSLEQIVDATPEASLHTVPGTAKSIEEEEPPEEMSKEPIVESPEEHTDPAKRGESHVDILIIDDDYTSPVEVREEEDEEDNGGKDIDEDDVDFEDHRESRKLINEIRENLNSIKTIIEEDTDENEDEEEHNVVIAEIADDGGTDVEENKDGIETMPIITDVIDEKDKKSKSNYTEIENGGKEEDEIVISEVKDETPQLERIDAEEETKTLNELNQETSQGAEDNEASNEDKQKTEEIHESNDTTDHEIYEKVIENSDDKSNNSNNIETPELIKEITELQTVTEVGRKPSSAEFRKEFHKDSDEIANITKVEVEEVKDASEEQEDVNEIVEKPSKPKIGTEKLKFDPEYTEISIKSEPDELRNKVHIDINKTIDEVPVLKEYKIEESKEPQEIDDKIIITEISNIDDHNKITHTEEHPPEESLESKEPNPTSSRNTLDVTDITTNQSLARLISHDSSTSLDSVATVVLTEDLNKFREEKRLSDTHKHNEKMIMNEATENQNKSSENIQINEDICTDVAVDNEDDGSNLMKDKGAIVDVNDDSHDVIVIDATELNNNNEDDIKFLASFVNAATKIQSAFRGFRVRNTKNNGMSNNNQNSIIKEKNKAESEEKPGQATTGTDENSEVNEKKRNPTLGQFLRGLAITPRTIMNSISSTDSKTEGVQEEQEETATPNEENSQTLQGTQYVEPIYPENTESEEDFSLQPFYLHDPDIVKTNPISDAIKMSSDLINKKANIGILHSGEFHDTVHLPFDVGGLYETKKIVNHDKTKFSEETLVKSKVEDLVGEETKETSPAGAERTVTRSVAAADLPPAANINADDANQTRDYSVRSASSISAHASSTTDSDKTTSDHPEPAGKLWHHINTNNQQETKEEIKSEEEETSEEESNRELDSSELTGFVGRLSSVQESENSEESETISSENPDKKEEEYCNQEESDSQLDNTASQPSGEARSATGMDPRRNNAIMVERNAESRAATKIQASFRGYQVRKQMQKPKNCNDVMSPKRNARRKTSGGRAPESKKLKDDINIEDKSATKIQAGVRGFLVRRRNQKKRDDV